MQLLRKKCIKLELICEKTYAFVDDAMIPSAEA